MSAVIFGLCLQGFHQSCVKYGPPPNTAGGTRVVCSCSCHAGERHDDPAAWKPADADRMALYMALEHGEDPRVEQLLEGLAALSAARPADTEQG